MNISKTFIYQAAVFFFMILVISFLGAFFPFRLKIRVKRLLPKYVGVKQACSYELEIENLTGKVQKGLVVFEEIHDPRPLFETFINEIEPNENKRNAWDRGTLYYRWVWLIQKKAKTFITPVTLPDLPPGKTRKIKITCLPRYRGYLQFSGVTIARPGILGLFNRTVSRKLTDKLLILPQIDNVAPLNLLSSRHHHQGGVSLASSIGNSDEFMSLRDYRPGDPMRSIHWKSVAKTAQLVMKEFEDEHFIRHSLILDTFTTAQNEDIFEKAVSLAASYVCQLQGPEAILDLLFAGRQVFSFSTGRGTGLTGKMLEVLACVEYSTQKSVLSLLPVLTTNIGKISGSVCIFLDWDKDRRAVYEMFMQAGIDVQVFVVARNPSLVEERILKEIQTLQRIKVVTP